MGDVSLFMKELKQRFSIWYNKSHRRQGTLWGERFKSVLVQDDPFALMTIAAYIDLNPVRAGIVSDPVEYRYCGYGEAMGGSKIA
ncbi:MAG: transposase, partial [Verrucomicrobiia bacterium]